MSDPKSNEPFKFRLLKIGDAGQEPKIPERDGVWVKTQLGAVDVQPAFKMLTELGAYIELFHKNPYDYRPLQAMRNVGRRAIPLFQQIGANPTLGEHFRPLAASLAQTLKIAQHAAKLRIKAAHDMARRPLIIVPISINQALGGTTTCQVRNPYLGSSGGQAVLDTYKAPWSITAFRTSNNENGQLQGVRMTQWLIGGHDYVAASLAGLTYVTPAPANQGWSVAAFAETKIVHHSTAFEPWNLTAESSAGWGFIMTETGFLQVGVTNVNQGATYTDTYSAYVRATLCGSPFERHTDIEHFRKSFLPLHRQYAGALKIAQDWHKNMGSLMGASSQEGGPRGESWVANLSDARTQIESFLDFPPPGIGEPLAYDHPAFEELDM
jgi:hypothetical protein